MPEIGPIDAGAGGLSPGDPGYMSDEGLVQMIAKDVIFDLIFMDESIGGAQEILALPDPKRS